jgi:stage II sporulation protein M
LIDKLQKIVKEHMAANRSTCLFLSLAFILGVSAGAFTVNGLSTMQRDELSNYLQGFLQLFGNQSVKSSELFSIGLAENLKIIGLLWILGVTIIGIPFIFIIMGVKGFVTGFSSGFIINAMGTKGILFSGLALLPKEIIIIPCLVFIGVNGINFSMRIAKSKSSNESQKTGLKTAFISYCLVTLLFSCIVMAGVLFDAYVTPVLIRMIIPSLAL